MSYIARVKGIALKDGTKRDVKEIKNARDRERNGRGKTRVI